jgi:DNA polymerase sliding clamp subunit (PCNA homolog)
MKITVQSSEFIKAINLATQVINERLNDTITLSVNKFGKTVEVKSFLDSDKLCYLVEGETSSTEIGAYGINTIKLRKFINMLAPQPITLNFDNKVMTIGYNNGCFAHFPLVDAPVETISSNDSDIEVFSFDTQSLLKALNVAVNYIHTDDARPTMCCVLLHILNSKLFVVATDGFRLYKEELCDYEHKDLMLLFSKESIKIISTILQKHKDNIDIKFQEGINKHLLLITLDNVIYQFSTINQKYPDYNRIIPEYDSWIEVNKKEFFSAAKRISLFSDEASRISISSNVMGITQEVTIVASNNDYKKDGSEIVDVVATGDISQDFKVCVYYNQLEIIEKHLDGDTFKIYIGLEMKPMLIRTDMKSLHLLVTVAL